MQNNVRGFVELEKFRNCTETKTSFVSGVLHLILSCLHLRRNSWTNPALSLCWHHIARCPGDYEDYLSRTGHLHVAWARLRVKKPSRSCLKDCVSPCLRNSTAAWLRFAQIEWMGRLQYLWPEGLDVLEGIAPRPRPQHSQNSQRKANDNTWQSRSHCQPSIVKRCTYVFCVGLSTNYFVQRLIWTHHLHNKRQLKITGSTKSSAWADVLPRCLTGAVSSQNTNPSCCAAKRFYPTYLTIIRRSGGE